MAGDCCFKQQIQKETEVKCESEFSWRDPAQNAEPRATRDTGELPSDSARQETRMGRDVMCVTAIGGFGYVAWRGVAGS